MVTALVLPALVALLWIAVPLGWADAPRDRLIELLRSPLSRLALFGFVTLSLFHWAHRFRYTLYDGLQLYHLNQLIAAVTYGIATLLTLVAGAILWTFP